MLILEAFALLLWQRKSKISMRVDLEFFSLQVISEPKTKEKTCNSLTLKCF